MTENTLVLELFTEELPPKALKRMGDAFASGVGDGLRKREFLGDEAILTPYASPRRLAVAISNVRARSPDREVREKILPVSVALDASGAPTAPLAKKLAAMGLADLPLERFERAMDGKAEAFFHTRTVPGASLAAGLQAALEDALAALPIPKLMSYQLDAGTEHERTVQFVRPAHRLLALHGSDVIDVTALGLVTGREAGGHRFMGRRCVTIGHADDYARLLHDEGKVVAGFAERRDSIRAALSHAAGDDAVVMPDALLDEVTALVEWPVIYQGTFDERFLDVPQECLILTMQQNQKYFALTDASGAIVNRFLVVSNIETDDPSAIIGGNERVLRARLADAKFFYDQDRKKTLESRVEGLKTVVYHNKLGSQYDRMQRVKAIAERIAEMLGYDIADARRAARIAKADLLTDMVGEFPELQGLMGRYYALHDDEKAEVAAAIEEQYRPRFAADVLPETHTGIVLALADKLETLTGMFAIGNVPSGDKDPFALRRHAYGVVRMLSEKRLDVELAELLSVARNQLQDKLTDTLSLALLARFCGERLNTYLRFEGYSASEVEAALSVDYGALHTLSGRLAAIRAFAALPEAESLAAANKRVGNILKKADSFIAGDIDSARLVEPAEVALDGALARIKPEADAAYERGDYAASLKALAALKQPVDAFFDSVMVNAEDAALRTNRLALLASLHAAMNRVADLSKLAA